MQKFVTFGDVHLKINRDAPVEWSFKRYRALFKEIIDRCLKEEATLIITGDLCDSARPTLSELKLLFEFFHALKDNKINTILISGNHEEVNDKLTLYNYLHLEKFGNKDGASYIHYQDWNSGWVFEDANGKPECSIYPVSHHEVHNYDYTRGIKGTRPSILVSHIRAEIPPFISEEAPINEIAKNFDVCIFGDIHDELEFDNVYYTNNPLNCCYEVTPNCGYTILTVDKGKFNIQRVKTDLPNLVKINTQAEAFENEVLKLDPKHFYKIEVEGLAAELKAIPKSGINFKTEKQIIEEIQTEEAYHIPVSDIKHETLEEELIWYMQQLEMNDKDIQGMMDEFV